MKVKYDLKPGDTVRVPMHDNRPSDVGVYIGLDTEWGANWPTVVFKTKKADHGWGWDENRGPAFKKWIHLKKQGYKYAWNFTESSLKKFYVLKTVDGRTVKPPAPPEQKKLLDVPSVPKEYIKVNRRKVENKTVKAEDIGI